VKEVESKYRASRDLVLPDLEGRIEGVSSVDAPDKMHLVAVYYDSADLRLAREGITLRRRSGGDDDGWHLKLPMDAADPGVRDEIQVAAGDEIPAQLRQAVTAYVRFAELQPAATLVTERTRRLLRDGDGSSLAELVDDTVTVEGLGRVSAGFREIEIEDKGGGSQLLAEVGTLLRDAGAVGGEFMPKLVRALGARATAPPDPPLAEPIGQRDPVSAVVTGYLRTNVRKLLAEDVRFRLGGEDAVHQLRVACRRLRSALRVFRPYLDEEWAEGLREELRWLATSMGTARDAEVILARLTASIDKLPDHLVIGPVRARVQQHLGGELAAAVAEIGHTVNSDRYISLLERLVDAAWKPRTIPAADQPAQVALQEDVRGAWRKLASGVARVRETSQERDYHQVRIRAKRVRYTAEAVSPAFGKPAVRFARQAERVQETLGEHQDACEAQDVLRRIAQSSAGRTSGFTLGILHAVEEQRASAARVEFEALWPEVARRRYRDWLTA
jgi:CHAD domain-containing protein